MNSNASWRTVIVVAALIVTVCIFQAGTFAATLVGDTSRPESSTFAIGEAVSLSFSVSGLAPSQTETLSVSVFDENGNPITTWQTLVAGDVNGNSQVNWTAPDSLLGFYRVYASLSDGTILAGLGSRPNGYLTYCIVPDPSQRVTPTEDTAHFGIQGGYNSKVNILPYLGIRWILKPFNWNTMEPTAAGQFEANVTAANAKNVQYPAINPATDSATYDGVPWQTYTIATLNYVPGWAQNPSEPPPAAGQGAIAASSLSAWANYCSAVATDYSNIYPGQDKHYYQLTWEPDSPYSYSGTSQELVQMYQTAYPALHAADPKAVVVGPTHNCLWKTAASWYQNLVKLGLTSCIDGVSIHPYFSMLTGPNVSGSELPETASCNGTLVSNLRALGAIFSGKPFLGTEQGFDTNGFGDATGGEDNELLMAESLIRENLIMLGEGYQLNLGFYISDVPGTNQDYGYYYNLLPGMPCGTSKMGPRPVAPAYAAQSFLLEGSTSDGPIYGLGTNEYGYQFHNGSAIILALWSNTTTNQTYTLPYSAPSVTAYDWMGNASVLTPVNGTISVSLGEEPIYVEFNSPPQIATQAIASPSQVNGNTSNLLALATDPSGAGNLTYTWSAVGTVPAPVTFSVNGTYGAQNTTATFGAAGTYNLQVAATDPSGLTALSWITVTVNQTVTSVTLSPSNATVVAGQVLTYTTAAFDQFGNLIASPLQSPVYTISGGGSISASTGTFAASVPGGPYVVTSTIGAAVGTASATVQAASNFVIAATSQNLTVGEASTTSTTINLTSLGSFSGSVSLSISGLPKGLTASLTNSSISGLGSSVITFTAALKALPGTSTIIVTGTSGNLTSSTTVSLTVLLNQVMTSATVLPLTPTVPINGSQQFTVESYDQFGKPMVTQPVYTWSVLAGGVGKVSANGLYSAGSVAGSAHVHAAHSGFATGTVATVSANGGFSLTTASPLLNVGQGSTGTITVGLQAFNGFMGSASLRVTGLPIGVTYSFSPATVASSTVSNLTFNVPASIPQGSSTITITGTSGSIIGTATVSLTIVAAQSQVSLASYYNLDGISRDNTAIPNGGGINGEGYALSGNLLGSSQTWSGASFAIGPIGKVNVITANGQSIALPTSSSGSNHLYILATAVMSSQPNQVFEVGYSTGAPSTFAQSVSDWCRGVGYAGESQAVPLPYYELYNHPVTGVNVVYGYSFLIDPTRNATSLTLPNNPNVKIIAVTLGT